MKISGIYKIQSILKPERIYIGSSKNIDKRWGEHLRDLRKNKHPNGRLQNHFNKYGEIDLMFSILLGCSEEYLVPNEQFFIDSHKPYFNLRPLANSNLGYKMSAESREKISNSNKGHPNYLFKHSEETKNKIRQANQGENGYWFGKHHSEETKRKISTAKKGTKTSEETKQLLRISSTGRHHTDESKKKISLAHKGKPISEQQKEILRISHLGIKRPPFTDDHKRKISEAQKGRPLTELHKQKLKDAWIIRKLRKQGKQLKNVS